MPIWNWIVVALLVAVLVYCMVRLRRRSKGPGDLEKPHGWLALLIAGLVFFGPLVGMGQISGDLYQTESQYPQLLNVPAWGSYKTLTWAVFIVAVALSVVAGVRLLRTRKRSAVSFAIAALWLSGPVAAIIMVFILPAVLFGSADISSETMTGMMKPFFGAIIWTAYLLRSTRVKARYVEASDTSSPAVVIQ